MSPKHKNFIALKLSLFFLLNMTFNSWTLRSLEMYKASTGRDFSCKTAVDSQSYEGMHCPTHVTFLALQSLESHSTNTPYSQIKGMLIQLKEPSGPFSGFFPGSSWQFSGTEDLQRGRAHEPLPMVSKGELFDGVSLKSIPIKRKDERKEWRGKTLLTAETPPNLGDYVPSLPNEPNFLK